MSRTAIETLNACGASWAGAMERSLIEGTIGLMIVGLVWMLLRRRMSSGLANGLFLLVLIKAALPLVLPVPPTVVFPVSAFALIGEDSTESSPPRADAAFDPAPRFDAAPSQVTVAAGEGIAVEVAVPAPLGSPDSPKISAMVGLMLAWQAIVVSLLARFFVSHVRMSRRLRDARVIPPSEQPVDLVRLANRAGLRRAVPLVETPWVSAPAVWGLLRPRMLIPPRFLGELPGEQLSWALLHELVHVRRRDTTVLLLQRLTQIVFFFHPAVWIANRAADVFREFACDDASLALTGIARQNCGAGFLAIAERACRAPSSAALAPLGLFGSYTLIRKRLERILDDKRTIAPRLSWAATLVLIVSAIAAIPQVRAQAPKPQAERGGGGSVEAPEPGTRPLALTVVDRRTGQPLPGVQLEITLNGNDHKAITDPFGRHVFNRPEAEPRRVMIKARKDGFVPTRVTWNFRRGVPVTPPASYTLRLEPGTTIGGGVRDPEGRPIAGATMYVLVPIPPSQRPEPEPQVDIWDYPSRTDAQGRWHCDIMPSELADVWIRLEHPDYASDTHYRSTPKPTMAQLRDGTGVMVMKKGVAILGVVRDANGRPLAGATVAQGSDRWGSRYPETETNADGRFRFGQVAPGEVVLTVQAKGHAPDLKTIRVVSDLPSVEFRLGPARSLRGRVVDRDGQPLAGALVVADTWRGHRSLSLDVKTGADGRFQVDDLPDEPVEFQFAHEGFMNLPNQRLAPAEKEVLITMTPPLKISGSVTDAASGQPIDRFTLYEGRDSSSLLTAQDRQRPRHFRDGRYAVNFGWPYPQVRTLHVEAAGYLSAVSRGFRFNEKTVVYDFKLKRGSVPVRPAISGVVRLPDGSPAAGAEVALAMKTAAPYMQSGRVAEPKRCPTVIAGADGSFQFPPQTEPAVVMAIDDRGYAEATEAQLAESPGHAMTLEPWGRVEGLLRVGARPGANERVFLSPYHKDLVENITVFFGYEVKADADGRFAFERVIPGRVSVSRQIEVSPNRFGYGTRMTMMVEPGKTAHANVGGTGRPVIGRVVRPPGQEASIDWTNGQFLLGLQPPPITEPPNMSREQRAAWYKTWSQTAEGKAYLAWQENPRVYGFGLARDGSFRIDDVPVGTYDLTFQFFEGPTRRQIATAERAVVVPPIPGGRSDEPLDLGAIELKVSP